MRALPNAPESPNIRALSQIYRERTTGLVGSTITLQYIPATTQNTDEGLEKVFKNGVLLDPGAQYTMRGKVITLSTAAVAGDVFVIHYPYRTGV